MLCGIEDQRLIRIYVAHVADSDVFFYQAPVSIQIWFVQLF